MSYRIVSIVDRAVRQGFDQVLWVPWKLGAQAIRAAACVLMEPINSVLKIPTNLVIISVDLAKGSFSFILPFYIAIFQVPKKFNIQLKNLPLIT